MRVLDVKQNLLPGMTNFRDGAKVTKNPSGGVGTWVMADARFACPMGRLSALMFRIPETDRVSL